MKMITARRDDRNLAEAVAFLKTAARPAALTGAGISVGSGIPDFRSPGGLWSVFSPEEYATLEVFHRHPAKAWELYRALGKVLLGKKPNLAHRALAELEQRGWLSGIVTQNIDNLHQLAGSRRVFEIHGDHQQLQCLQCEHRQPIEPALYETTEVPPCPSCGFPLKPNVVLFGEAVRDLEAIHEFIKDCDLLLVIGTSAQVYPAADLPAMVRNQGGRLIECNREQMLPLADYGRTGHADHFFFQGDVGLTLPMLAEACRTAP